MTPDGPPVIGRERYENLYLNTGHGTLGWTMACGSGRAVADARSHNETTDVALTVNLIVPEPGNAWLILGLVIGSADNLRRREFV